MKHSTLALTSLLMVLLASPVLALEKLPKATAQVAVYKNTRLKNATSNNKAGLKALAQKQYSSFKTMLDHSLYGKGKATFQLVSNQVKRNIQWRDDNGTNDYNEAFRRSYDFTKTIDLQGLPVTTLLIAYMESQWQGKTGRKARDYGFWQLTPEVLREIQQLDQVPKNLRKAHIDRLREDPHMSTVAAQTHLRRYYFYFAKVAKYSESDAWLFTFTSYNWGAGNVKRMLAEMESKGIKPDFSNFYYYLYNTYQKNKGDIHLRAAVNYTPSLWNIAQLVRSAN